MCFVGCSLACCVEGVVTARGGGGRGRRSSASLRDQLSRRPVCSLVRPSVSQGGHLQRFGYWLKPTSADSRVRPTWSIRTVRWGSERQWSSSCLQLLGLPEWSTRYSSKLVGHLHCPRKFAKMAGQERWQRGSTQFSRLVGYDRTQIDRSTVSRS